MLSSQRLLDASGRRRSPATTPGGRDGRLGDRVPLPVGPLFCVIDVSSCTTGFPLPLIQRQLGHSHLSTTGTYRQGIDTEEIISTVNARRAPMMHAGAASLCSQAAGAHPRSRTPAARDGNSSRA
jgi:hypothetical protein